MIEGLRRLRLRLTVWYIGVFAVLLLGFGAALLWAVAQEASGQLNRSLHEAGDAIVEAAEIRVREGGPRPGRVDALDELHIPDRALYLFDGRGRLLHPDTASAWIRDLARATTRDQPLFQEMDLAGGITERAYAASVTLSEGERRVVVAAGQVLEIDHQYPGLLLAFAAAALGALLLAGLGGWILALRSIRPVDAAFTSMRRFMADAAHELRTPVSVIRGHADVALRQPAEPQEYLETLRTIRAETERLGGILGNILTLANADTGAWPERRESLFLDDILLDSASSARVLAEERHISLEMTALEEMPVRGDPDLLRQLFLILLDNAIKFSPPHSTVRLRARQHGRTGRIEVEDEGPGIPEDALAHVFERFYRGDPARGRAPGAGLGLPIARWIAASHSGTVALVRAPRGGTIAIVTLPLDEA